MATNTATDDTSIDFADEDTDETLVMRTKCCTSRTVLVSRQGHTYRECDECGKSSPPRERVPLDDAQAAFEARQ